MTKETPAAPHEILAHIMAATIAMQKFHPDPRAQEAGNIIAGGIGSPLLALVGEDKALDMFEACYAILNAGPLKGTGIHAPQAEARRAQHRGRSAGRDAREGADMRVNQQDAPIIEEVLFASWTSSEDPLDIARAISCLCEHLNIEIIRTNATKHGNTEVQIRSTGE